LEEGNFTGFPTYQDLTQSISEGESRFDYAKGEKPVPQKNSDIKGGFRTYQAYRKTTNHQSGTSDIRCPNSRSREQSTKVIYRLCGTGPYAHGHLEPKAAALKFDF
jgi:hypothetical protein